MVVCPQFRVLDKESFKSIRVDATPTHEHCAFSAVLRWVLSPSQESTLRRRVGMRCHSTSWSTKKAPKAFFRSFVFRNLRFRAGKNRQKEKRKKQKEAESSPSSSQRLQRDQFPLRPGVELFVSWKTSRVFAPFVHGGVFLESTGWLFPAGSHHILTRQKNITRHFFPLKTRGQ